MKSFLKPVENNKKLREVAIIICCHGSKDGDFKQNLTYFIKEIKQSFKDVDIFSCFVEINHPSIDECLEKVASLYKKIIFSPLLILNGEHYKFDVISKIKLFEKKFKKKVHITENIKIKSELITLYTKKIFPKIKQNYSKVLITVTSKTKNNLAKNNIESFILILSKKLGINNIFIIEFGSEKKVFEKIRMVTKGKEKVQFFLNPLFLFNGFLYKKTIEKFTTNFDGELYISKPLIKQKEISNLFKEKIKNSFLQLKI